MKRLVCGYDEVVGPWVAAQSGGQWTTNRGVTIGLVNEHGDVLAGVIYEDATETNIICHIAGAHGSRWMTRFYLWAIFDYPFEQVKLKRITAPVRSTNAAARSFVEHLGFTLEATLKDAIAGGDMLLYVMRREDCRWLSLRKRYVKVESDQQRVGSHDGRRGERNAHEQADGSQRGERDTAADRIPVADPVERNGRRHSALNGSGPRGVAG